MSTGKGQLIRRNTESERKGRFVLPRGIRSVVVACALAHFSALVCVPQSRLKGRVQTPENNPQIVGEWVSIEGAGQHRTQEGGEFEFDLAGDLKVGQPARFHVIHANPAIKIQQWVVVRPCDLKNGRTLSLPAVGSEPITIVVLARGDPRLKSLNRNYSILGCIIEEIAANFEPASRPEGAAVVAESIFHWPLYKSPVSLSVGIPGMVEAAYRVRAQQKPAPSLVDFGVSERLGQVALAMRAAELGFTGEQLVEALDAWARTAEDNYQKGLAALYERRFAEASSNISASIPSPPSEFLKRYVPLARAEYEQGHYSAAEAALRMVLAVHPEDSLILNNLGVVLMHEAKFVETESLLERAVRIDEKALGTDHPTVAAELNNLGMLYKSQGRYTEAEPLLKRALAIDEKTLGQGHPGAARDLNNLAELYRTQGKYAEAEPLYKRAITIDEKVLGPEHSEVATYLSNLGLLYNLQERYAEAKPLHERALTIHEETLGPDHPDVAIDLNNLASVYKSQGNYAEAEFLLKRALKIDEKALGPDHPEVGIRLNNLGLVYKSQGKYAEAEPLYNRALAIDQKALGQDHPEVANVLNNLGFLYFSRGKYAEAEPLLKHALEIDEKALGLDHPMVSRIAENLGADLRKLGRNDEAKVYEDQAARTRAKRKK